MTQAEQRRAPGERLAETAALIIALNGVAAALVALFAFGSIYRIEAAEFTPAEGVLLIMALASMISAFVLVWPYRNGGRGN